jgi:flagellar protein FlgJ
MTTPTDTVSPKSYLDFSGLGELRGQAQKDQSKAIQQSAQQFEGLFIQMMMKSMRDATPKDEEHQSSALDTFQGMFDQEVSVQMAKRNAIGVADYMVKAVQQQGRPVTSSDFLKARQAPGPALPLNPPAKSLSLEANTQAIPLSKPAIKSLNALKFKGGL